MQDEKTDHIKIDVKLNKLKRFSILLWNRWLRHCVLILCLITYVVIGAFIFLKIEENYEKQYMDIVWETRDNVLHELWMESHLPKMTFLDWRSKFIDTFSGNINELCVAQAWVHDDKYVKIWDYGNSLRYCCSVFFSIGYGDMYPKTNLGRFVTIIYLIIGIPFAVFCINFYGVIFRETMYRSYNMFLFFYYTGKVGKFMLLHVPPVRLANKTTWTLHALTISHGSRPAEYSIGVAEKKWAKREVSEFEMPVIVPFIMVILFIFIMGHIIFIYFENWTAMEAAYFLFIVLFTIGYGDYVITDSNQMLMVHIMLFIGFVMMTMLLNVIQQKPIMAIADVNRRAEANNMGAHKIETHRMSTFLGWISFLWNGVMHHFILIFILAFYTVGGALLFAGLEYNQHIQMIEQVWDVRDDFLRKLWFFAHKPGMTYSTWKDIFISSFEKDRPYLCFDRAWIPEDKFEPLWTFGNAVRFSSSIFFTIGYGDMYPVTTLGRVVTIVYAILGVPFVLYCVNFYGDVFTRILLKVWNLVLKFYYTGLIRKFKLIHPPPARSINMASWIIHTLSISYGGRPDRNSITDAERRWISTEKQKKTYLTELPFLAALYIVSVFILVLGYLIFTYLENWNALEAYYYLFTVFLTVGFGDYVLTNSVYMVMIHVMLFIGFVLMTVLLNAIQKNVGKITQVTGENKIFSTKK